MTRNLSLPELALARVEQDLRVATDDIKQTEDALKLDSNDGVLMKKYEALLRDRQILLEGRNESISECSNFSPYMPASITLWFE